MGDHSFIQVQFNETYQYRPKKRGIEMLNLIADLSQRKAVTVLRFLYPIWFVVGPFSLMYVPATLIVAGDATTTANNIMANELLWRMGIAGSLIVQIIQIVIVLVLYKLLKPVNKNHALLMVIFILLGAPIAMLNELNRFVTLLLLSGADYLTVFTVDQLQALVPLFLDLHEQGITIAGIFWSLWLFPMGYLVFKSGFLPRILGILLMIACFGYLIDSFGRLLLPNFDATIVSTIVGFMLWGELLFPLWLLIKGVNAEQWEKCALESA